MTPTKIFIAYSRQDELLLKQLRVFLRPLERRNDIKMWYDGIIMPGEKWEQSIKDNLHAADIILLLMSADAIASDYFWEKEKADALERHHKGSCKVVPIILKPCGWKYTELAALQALPKDGKPITTWGNPEEALNSVLEGLAELVESLQKVSPPAPIPIVTNEEIHNPTPSPITLFIETCHQAEEAHEKKEWKEARRLYNEALKQHQNGFKPTREAIQQRIDDCTEELQVTDHLQRAQKYETQQKYTEAIAELQKAIGLKPELQNNYKTQLQDLVAKRQTAEQAESLKKLPAPIQQLLYDMVLVEGGTFMMGSNDGNANEKPVHQVTLNNYYIGKYEVTLAQFKAFIEDSGYNTDAEKGTGGYGSYIWENGNWNNKDGINWRHDVNGKLQSDDRHPVIHISWNDAMEFCKWLSSKTGKNFTLPTEAEWEYAARGGNKSKGYQYAGSNEIGSVAWHSDNSGYKTHPVGLKQANELGLYDMSGNVWEWCSDWYGENYYANSPANNPKGPDAGSLRVLRGGSWLNFP